MCQTANRVYVYGIDHEARVFYWGRPDCKLWSCPDCAEVNKRRWMAIVAEGIKEYQEKGETEWRFITLTARGDRRGWETSLHDFRQRWPKLHARMNRRWGKHPYVLLPERHRDGTYHMHGIFAGCITTRWLKDASASCGFGYKADAQPLSSHIQAVAYVLKYVTKSLQNGTLWPKSLHRVRTSHKWPKQALEREIDLPVPLQPMRPAPFLGLLESAIASGFQVVNFLEPVEAGQLDLSVDMSTGELVTNWSSLVSL